MKRREEVPRVKALLSTLVAAAAELAGPLSSLPQWRTGVLCVLRRVNWQLVAFCLGLVVQAGLSLLVWRLVDLCISLFEAWTLLARYSLGGS